MDIFKTYYLNIASATQYEEVNFIYKITVLLIANQQS
jgi:hypothetical protein